jgi:hypothetical protein
MTRADYCPVAQEPCQAMCVLSDVRCQIRDKSPQPQSKQEPAEYDHGPQAETLAEAERDVRKWLNERPNRLLDLRHVAMLAWHAQQSVEQKPEAFKPLEKVWRWTALKDGKEIYQYSDKGVPAMFSKSAVQLPMQADHFADAGKPMEPDHFPDARKMMEPFGYFRSTLGGWEDCAETDEGARPLYEAPQPDHFADAGKPIEREWVDLLPEEIRALANLPGAGRERTAVEMAYAVQAKLREKNT